MEKEVVREKMERALELLREELVGLKVGRPTPALVEKVMVEAYETRMPLVELATITTSGPRQLTIVPFDPSIIKNIERALALEKRLGSTPMIDEKVIRLNFPPLTEERRQEFIKLLRQKLEAARVMIRQIRQQEMIKIRRQFEAKELNEDEKFQLEQDLQKLTDEFNQKIKEIGEEKEKELLSL